MITITQPKYKETQHELDFVFDFIPEKNDIYSVKIRAHGHVKRSRHPVLTFQTIDLTTYSKNNSYLLYFRVINRFTLKNIKLVEVFFLNHING